ncbi:MAG: SGNH/GDSL hydrolase family protein [Candidatus Brocadiaceae bacterium]|nr:SGNH/GDSL hydrolase family protein [Candidatus Brocadiaceae bacterium]
MRTLTVDELCACARGAAEVVERTDGLHFARWQPAARECWQKIADENDRPQLMVRVDCSTGVVLDFLTDAASVSVEATLDEGARRVAHFDLWVDGAFAGCLGSPEPGDCVQGEIVLPPGDGQRHCTLYLPQSRPCHVRTVGLSEGASFAPAAALPVLLALGDSITQGMDSVHPGLTFPAVAGRRLGMTVHNGGVGGWIFDVGSLPEPPVPAPALVLVAFGTNDFSNGLTPEPAGPYLEQVRRFYPEAPVAVLEPLWRSAYGGETGRNAAGRTLSEYRAALRDVVAGFQGVQLVRMEWQLPPGDAFLEDGLHPTTAGHMVLGENVARALAAAGLRAPRSL